MEFYELNRLYDKNLEFTNLSRYIDHYLYILMPVVILFGCLISAINILIVSRPYYSPMTSKSYLYTQSVFQILFQLSTTFIFITNYYESLLVDANFFLNDKMAYFNLKTLVNFAHKVFLYCSIWLFTIGALDFCLIAIVKFHFNLNFNRIYKQLFFKQQKKVYCQQKLLKDRLKLGGNE